MPDVQSITFHCPHMDCECDYLAPRLAVGQRQVLAALFREHHRLTDAGRPISRTQRKGRSQRVKQLDQEMMRLFREYAGEQFDMSCLAHMARVKNVCFMCGGLIVGDDLVYCQKCGTPNFNW